MLAAVILATVVSTFPQAAPAAQLTVLHIKITLVDPDGKATPVPRHALLISDNPASAAPRRIVTTLDGLADVQLRPGSYTVESDKPFAFHGKAYQWTQLVNVRAGREATLELTATNAEVETASASNTATTTTGMDTDPLALLMPWQDTVVALWTPIAHASGFVIDPRGLVATNQRVVGKAASVEVQFGPANKVEARVLATDPARNVAVLWIDPNALGAVRPLPLGCVPASKPSVVDGQEIFTIGSPLREPKAITSGLVRDTSATGIVFDARLPTGSAGGPVFSADGKLLGISDVVDEKDDAARGDSRVVPVDAACEVVAAAEKKMTGAAPSGARLPVEPAVTFPLEALKSAAQRRVGSLNPYQISSTEFDINFITPVMTYGVEYQAEIASRRERQKGAKLPEPPMVSPFMDFVNWSEYVSDFPPVLLIRVTPKFEEGFWTKVARGAASTQGMAIPPIKRFAAVFSRMQAYCGDREVTPIHRFKLERQFSETVTIEEGLYVFEPFALNPECGSVKLVIYNEKEPTKADSRVVEPNVIQQIKDDFAPIAVK